MKTLKLEHDLANKVRSGVKTTTWRLYDDKNLSVNDEVELIDKVDPADPATWIVMGMAQIDKIIEKRLGDITADDYDDSGSFISSEATINIFKKYYGPQVTQGTPVRMVHFTFKKGTAKEATVPLQHLNEAKMYADGGSRGNPGPSASGFVVLNMADTVVLKKGVYLGITTNNQAEYQALKYGMEEAQRMGIQTLHVYMDSLLVVNQMLGIFKVKNRDLWPIHESIKATAMMFKKVTYKHIPRELNKLADAAVNETLDSQVSPR